MTKTGRDWVAIILAGGLVAVVVVIVATVLYNTVVGDSPGLSDNAAQVLNVAIAAFAGLLGAYLGRGGAPPSTSPPEGSPYL